MHTGSFCRICESPTVVQFKGPISSGGTDPEFRELGGYVRKLVCTAVYIGHSGVKRSIDTKVSHRYHESNRKTGVGGNQRVCRPAGVPESQVQKQRVSGGLSVTGLCTSQARPTSAPHRPGKFVSEVGEDTARSFDDLPGEDMSRNRPDLDCRLRRLVGRAKLPSYNFRCKGTNFDWTQVTVRCFIQ